MTLEKLKHTGHLRERGDFIYVPHIQNALPFLCLSGL